MADVTPTLPMSWLTLFQKRLLGSLYGEANPRADIPRLLSLYREGKLLLDETVTSEYKLNDINEAYDDMLAGRNIRGVDHPRPLIFDCAGCGRLSPEISITSCTVAAIRAVR